MMARERRPAPPSADEFARRVIEWQRCHGRHDLPWQNVDDAYRVWLSEIMLQQTQVSAVIPYFRRFIERFPTLQVLAEAAQDDVLAIWSGLGYYARGRNLHRAARLIGQAHGGRFPERFADIAALPGVGRSTAGAIAVFAFDQRHPILDGNVKRVLARCFAIDGYPGAKAVADRLWALAEALLPAHDVRTYTQGLMDLGSQVCTRSRPLCTACPLASQCQARLQGRVASLPAPRPRKARPQRSTAMLLIERDDGALLLEKRPATGIWGGLWSFPEMECGADAAQMCLARFGHVVQEVAELAPIEHGFTHFSLRIAPLLCRVGSSREGAQMPGRQWLVPDAARQFPIPVPVRQILSQLDARAGQLPV